MAAVSLVDKISHSVYNRLTTVGIFIDLSSPFDKIDYGISIGLTVHAFDVWGSVWFVWKLSTR